MSKRNEVLNYISSNLEIGLEEIGEEKGIVDLYQISNVHEDEKVHFFLNFLDHFSIYTRERDPRINFRGMYNGVFSIILRPFAKVLNLVFFKPMDLDEVTVRDMVQMAEQGYWHK